MKMKKSGWLLAVFFLSALLANVSFAFPTNGLVAHYTLDGNANDSSSYENNGTVYGATQTTDRYGNENSAMLFDGINDYIKIPAAEQNFMNDQFSLSFWFNSNGASEMSILSKNGTMPITNYMINTGIQYSSGNSVGLWVEDSVDLDYRLQAGYDSSYYDYSAAFPHAPSNNPESHYVFANSGVTANEWTHVAMVREGELFELYVNGVLSGYSLWDIIEPTGNEQSLFLGTGSGDYFGVSSYWFEGAIDDLGLYNRSLSGDEISNIYNTSNAAAPVPEPTTMLLLGSGLIGLVGFRRKFKKV